MNGCCYSYTNNSFDECLPTNEKILSLVLSIHELSRIRVVRTNK
jgi:hypothetical protein